MPKPAPSPRSFSDATAESQVQALEAERRSRQTRARLEARAAGCDDPSLRRLLQRFAASHGRRSVGTGQPELGEALAPNARKASQDQAAVGVEATVPDEVALALRERVDVTSDLLILKVDRPQGFQYRAGQHTKFGVPGTLRTYSLVSAPHESHLEFFIELLPGGRLSAMLAALEVGAPVALGDRAKGDLALDSSRRNHLMVATVTGIAPIISMLRDYFRHPGNGQHVGHRFIVLSGASYADEHGYRDELDAMAAYHPESLIHVPAVSRPREPRNSGWQGATGRLDALATRAPGSYGLSPDDTAMYACGHPGMVAQVSEHFVARGYPVHTEPYD